METYVSEQEQVEQLRRWWKSNGQALVLGLALGLGGLAAYRYWDASRDSQAMNASINYEAMVQMTAAQKLDDAASAGRTIIEAYPDTLYARLSGLLLAKIAVQKHDYEAAKKELQALLAADGKGEIADIARTRLARLLLAEGKAEEAGKLLAQVPTRGPMDASLELRGDVAAARGDQAAARKLYAEALAGADKLGLDSETLQLKLDNLAVASSPATKQGGS